MHLCEHFLRKGLGDLVEVDLAAGLFDSLFFSFGQLVDMAVHRVEDDCDLGCHFGCVLSLRVASVICMVSNLWKRSRKCPQNHRK